MLVVLTSAAMFATACGNNEDSEPAAAGSASAKQQPVDVAQRRVALERNPQGVRCSDIRDERSTRNTRLVQHALAADVRIRGLSELAVSQSIYYGLTEICKGRPGTYEPAQEAIAGVKSGKYRAEL
jgi:hypothetical protein